MDHDGIITFFGESIRWLTLLYLFFSHPVWQTYLCMDCFYCNVCTVPVLYYSKLSQLAAGNNQGRSWLVTHRPAMEKSSSLQETDIQLLPTTAG
jgi:hypothetical protein